MLRQAAVAIVAVLLAQVPAGAKAQCAGGAPCDVASAAPARPLVAEGESDPCEDEGLECGADEVCRDGECVPVCPGGACDGEPEPRPAIPAVAAPPRSDAPVSLFWSAAAGPMLFAMGDDPWAIAMAVGAGVRLRVDDTFSVPVRFDARYVLADGGALYSFQPSAGFQLDFGNAWIALTGGFCRWPAAGARSGLHDSDTLVAGASGTIARRTTYIRQGFRFDEYGGHIGVRYGWSNVVLDGGIDIFKLGTIQYVMIGVAM